MSAVRSKLTKLEQGFGLGYAQGSDIPFFKSKLKNQYMKKSIKIIVHVDWPEEDDYDNSLVIEDTGVLSCLKDGVTIEIPKNE